MDFLAARDLGDSEMFVPENRHYPDGFTVDLNGQCILVRDPAEPTGLRAVHTQKGIDPTAFRFDASRLRLIVSRWPGRTEACSLTIRPGFP
jgi:hypothetical protein